MRARAVKRLLLPAGIVIWIVAVALSVVRVNSFASGVDTEQVRLERELTTLRREHKALQETFSAFYDYVADDLRPWVIHQAYKQSAALPETVPTPSLEPLPPVPSVEPTPSASPSPEPSPTVDPLPTDVPTPSPTCVPVVDICL